MFLNKIAQQKLSLKINFSVKLSDIFLLLSAASLMCGVILFAHLNEDAFIIFRSIENFINGYGLQYVIDDRSQSYTDPLWIICHVLLRLVFGDIRLVSIYFSFACTLAMILVIVYHFKANRWLIAFFIFIPLNLSVSFLEYSTSGLENPLSHFLAAWFFCTFLKEESLKNISNQKIFFLFTLACFAILNRFDTVIFYALPLLYIALIRKNGFIKTSLLVGLAFFPLFVWLAFATFYYGYPLPDTYYAKLVADTPARLMIFFGLNYYYRFAEINLSSAFLILTSLIFSLTFLIKKFSSIKLKFFCDESLVKTACITLSLMFYLYYCLSIGDYMLGRFFTIALLISTILLVHNFLQSGIKAPVLSALFVILMGLSTFNHFEHNFIYKCRRDVENGNCEKNSYEYKSGTHIYRLFGQSWNFMHRDHISTDWQDLGWMIKVMSQLEDTKRPLHLTNYSAGVMPFYAGPYYWITDQLGYTEPFLVRLPAASHNPGHFVRNLPENYLDWRFNQATSLDSDLAHYYNNLRDIKTLPLFSGERLKKIMQFNGGAYDSYLDRYTTQTYIPDMLKKPHYQNPVLVHCEFFTKLEGSTFGTPFRSFICKASRS